ncbi:carbohydrate-binding module family 18 protein [Apiospora kogelbergensis]|uniref:Carbohydrate-binding module family 18 protein n=1 Tax=Apiospora kogelbergensis TaxID=1337665 RepID=A0AAW0Q236_9PEZI
MVGVIRISSMYVPFVMACLLAVGNCVDSEAEWPEPNVVNQPPLQPGDVNCRYSARTNYVVDQKTCERLCDSNEITIEKFLMLNPTVARDCSNIQPNSEYCVRGFIEPVRAYDGRCGPKYRNATCSGMAMGQCCNKRTWQCGQSIVDCHPEICYKGGMSICGRPSFRDTTWTKDQTCGYILGERWCNGEQDVCCRNLEENDYCGISTWAWEDDNKVVYSAKIRRWRTDLHGPRPESQRWV